MSDWSLSERTVKITADRGVGAKGGQFSHGSGCLIGGTTVLTAAHVVVGSLKLWVRRADLVQHEASCDPQFVGDPTTWSRHRAPGPDLALLTVEDAAAWHVPPIDIALVSRDGKSAQIERVRAVGYPVFAIRARNEESDVQDATAQTEAKTEWIKVPVSGVVELSDREDGLLDLHVTLDPPASPGQSQWGGMSGAPVTAQGRLIGVVNEHAKKMGNSALAIVPLSAIDADSPPQSGDRPKWSAGAQDPDGWWARLGVTNREDLTMLPSHEADYRATLREMGRALHVRMPRLVGREDELHRITDFATGPPGYLWLTGGAYAGKTALMYEVVTSGILSDEVEVVAYFVNAREFDDSDRFLNAVVPQLELVCGKEHQNPSPDRFNELWQDACSRARPLLLVIDALDEDQLPGKALIYSRLPGLLGPRGHVLVSSRPYPDIRERLNSTHPLKTCPRLELSAFPDSEKAAEQAKEEIAAIAESGDRDVLGLLIAAAGALSKQDLAALLAFPADPTKDHRDRVGQLVDSPKVARSLEWVGSQTAPRYRFAHRLLVKYARTIDRLTDPDYRQAIDSWADSWRSKGWPRATPQGAGTPRYLLDAYPATLVGDPDHPDLLPAQLQRRNELLTDLAWIDTAIRGIGIDEIRATLNTAPTTESQQLRTILAAQASSLRITPPPTDSGFVLRQIGMQALWYGMIEVAGGCASRMDEIGADAVPTWTSDSASLALS